MFNKSILEAINSQGPEWQLHGIRTLRSRISMTGKDKVIDFIIEAGLLPRFETYILWLFILSKLIVQLSFFLLLLLMFFNVF
jgi:hypothetical protein